MDISLYIYMNITYKNININTYKYLYIVNKCRYIYICMYKCIYFCL